jgi:CubicO group peptidase (beta-lactamase class C family)
MTVIDFSPAEAVIQAAVPDLCPAAQIVVRRQGGEVFSGTYGWLDPETRRREVSRDSRFDLASVTKLFVVTTFMTLVEEGRVALDQPVSTVLPEVSGLRPVQPYEDPLTPGAFVHVVPDAPPVDMGCITFRHLLAHSSGLPAWRPLFRQGSRDAALRMALSTPPAYPTGTHTIYSDIGLILLGLAVEHLAGAALDQAVHLRVTGPLGLAHTGYLPIGTVQAEPPANVAPTEICAWRKRRIVGEVHDENAAALGGVAGHAGLFSNAADVARFGQVFLDRGRPLLGSATVAEMAREQAAEGTIRRGLGFALWSPDPEASGSPFSASAFGHTGFTGTSLWIDPERSLVVALLTNDVYHGRAGRRIGALRVAVHRAIVAAVDAAMGDAIS